MGISLLRITFLLFVCTLVYAKTRKPYLRNGIPDDQSEQASSPSALKKDRPPTCRKSFESACDMYWYVRFWNKEFHAEDCYDSPLRHPAKDKAPWDERKYVVFQPDIGGWNNIRMGAETVIIFAHATGRTLVMPPMMKFYLLHEQSSFQKFFDFTKIIESLDIISMDDFIENVAKKGLLETPYPNGLTTQQKKNLWNYMQTACQTYNWSFQDNFVGFNISASAEAGKGVIGPINSSKHGRRFKEMIIHKRTVLPYDEAMHSHRALFFPGEGPARMLTHFYAYLYWTDPHIEQIYMRIVRDRLHYHDDIFCGAGQIVRAIHQEAARLTGKPVPTISHASFKTLGGDTNQDATYYAYHIRRGDFQYNEARLSAEEIWENTRHLLDPSVTTLIYIATDERNRSFFAPMMQPPYQVRFLDAFFDLKAPASGKGGVNLNHVGMMEQVICANAHTFFGTQYSTFTGYITRMRGYYRDGRYARTYYTKKDVVHQLQQHPRLGPVLWAREYARAHEDIDDFWQP